MASLKLYNHIYSTNKKYITSGNIEIDQVLASKAPDKRIGISLIIPVVGIDREYKKLINNLKKIEPNHYYYPAKDLHVTIFEYLVGQEGYVRNTSLENKFIEITKTAIKGVKPFPITYSGIVFSQAAGLIQGFDNGKLIGIRNRIRKLFKINNLPNQERYQSKSAHSTFCRFTSKLINPEKLSIKINQNRNYLFGQKTIKCFQLVEHDWYNTLAKKRIIKSFDF